MTYDFGYPNPGLEQAQNCGGVKPVNGIPTSVLLYSNPSLLRPISSKATPLVKSDYFRCTEVVNY